MHAQCLYVPCSNNNCLYRLLLLLRRIPPFLCQLWRELALQQGYEPSWDSNHTTLTCVRSNDDARHNQLQAVILGTVFGVAFVLAGLFAWGIYLRTRPRWLRERQQQAKRLKGAPIANRPGDKASVSIVVTDVKVRCMVCHEFYSTICGLWLTACIALIASRQELLSWKGLTMAACHAVADAARIACMLLLFLLAGLH
jgi:hypothetical protein